MPWHISNDLKRFKALTTGHPVIMGRKTFDSILGYLKKPLPERENIIISRSNPKNNFNAPVFSDIVSSINHAKKIADRDNVDEIFIIGGAQIYTQSLDQADCLHLTLVHRRVDGDAFFPAFDTDQWHEITREDHMDHDPPYSFVTLDRK